MDNAATVARSARVEREIVATFRRHRALSGGAALRLRDLGLVGNPVLKGMMTRYVIRRAGPERYFLHEPSWTAESQAMPWLSRVAIAIIVAGVALAIYLANRPH